MSRAPLLLEIGCEEIPAHVIETAAAELAERLLALLDEARLAHGLATVWGGLRRLAVRVEQVQERQADREEQVLGPPARLAFSEAGELTAAAIGFARKQGMDPSRLMRLETDRGSYVGFVRAVPGRDIAEVLAAALPGAVEQMSFPKSMRWGDGRRRWVRPVHWVLALHGDRPLSLELLGVAAASRSFGHRFLSPGTVEVSHPERYLAVLEQAFVLVDPAERCRRLQLQLARAAEALGGALVEDSELLDQIVNLVEWPGVSAGRFDEAYLELPQELLMTTLRHHQKCFSVRGLDGQLRPGFLAVANTDQDPAGHIRRGNEWVVGGRLEDARFFWREDRQTPLAALSSRLAGVIFHAKCGTYADRAQRMQQLAAALAQRLGPQRVSAEHVGTAAGLAKNDLVTSTVGEFPELQGRVGGLLLAAEGAARAVARAVYSHYQPAGADDAIPDSAEGCVVSLADRLDSLTQCIRAGEAPTGSRDPLGLRRATNGIFRIIIEADWTLSLMDLFDLTQQHEDTFAFLKERWMNFLKERGFSPNEILAVHKPTLSATEFLNWPLVDIVARLQAIRTVRQREDFAHLVDLTKRVDNILTKNVDIFAQAIDTALGWEAYEEREAAALALFQRIEQRSREVSTLEQKRRYAEVIDVLAGFVQPVERFFTEVLVINPEEPQAMLFRRNQLAELKGVLTRCFDIRELAGQASGRSG